MKTTTITTFCLLIAGMAFAQPSSTTSSNPNPNGAEISFKTDNHEFGTVGYDAKTSYEYEFTNTGKEPLIISEVKPQCGCTIPSWPKEPIAPGKSGKIAVAFDTKRVGTHNKSVTVMSNAKTANKVLTFSITVAPAPTDGTPVNTNPGAPKEK